MLRCFKLLLLKDDIVIVLYLTINVLNCGWKKELDKLGLRSVARIKPFDF